MQLTIKNNNIVKCDCDECEYEDVMTANGNDVDNVMMMGMMTKMAINMTQ